MYLGSRIFVPAASIKQYSFAHPAQVLLMTDSTSDCGMKGETKCAVVLTALLSGRELWTFDHSYVKLLGQFH